MNAQQLEKPGHVPEIPYKPDWYTYPVEVKMTKTMGLGLFATRDIPKNSPLCWYDGIMTKDYRLNVLISGKNGYMQDLSHGKSIQKTISGFPAEYREGGCAQLCNDASCDLKTYENKKYWKKINVKLGNIDGCETLVFVSRKNIRKGDQIFYNYGREYWENKKDDTVRYKEMVDEVFLAYNFPEKYKKKLPTGHTAKDVLKRHKFFDILFNLEENEASSQ